MLVAEERAEPARAVLPTRDAAHGDVRIAVDWLKPHRPPVRAGGAVGDLQRVMFGFVDLRRVREPPSGGHRRRARARVELANYLIAGFLSVLAAILLALIVTLNAAIRRSPYCRVLAAALVGRFSSFGLTVAAALVLRGFSIRASSRCSSRHRERVARQHRVADGPAPGGIAVDHPRRRRGLGRARPLGDERPAAVTRQRDRPRPPARHRGGRGTGLLGPSYSSALITTFGIGIIIELVIVVSGYVGQLSLCQYALAGLRRMGGG